MSHFTVLVVGDDIEGQLARYSENYEGIEPYKEDFDAADNLAEALKHLRRPADPDDRHSRVHEEKLLRDKYADPDHELSLEEQVEVLAWYCGGDLRIEDGQVARYTTFNPDGKWDWYETGGRWRGFFRLKPGAPGFLREKHWSEDHRGDTPPEDYTGRADQALKKDIDFDAMREHAEAEARARWAEIEQLTQGIAPPTEGWKQVLDRHGVAAIDAARTEYNTHPWVKAVRPVDFGWGDPFETYCLDQPDPKAAYIARCRATAIQTYAMVHQGEWISKGRMGWFGVSDDEESSEVFGQRQWDLIESLPDDTMLTLVDAHV